MALPQPQQFGTNPTKHITGNQNPYTIVNTEVTMRYSTTPYTIAGPVHFKAIIPQSQATVDKTLRAISRIKFNVYACYCM